MGVVLQIKQHIAAFQGVQETRVGPCLDLHHRGPLGVAEARCHGGGAHLFHAEHGAHVGGHLGVFVGLFVKVLHIAQQGVAAIGNANGHAVVAKQRVFPHGGIIGQGLGQRAAQHVGGDFNSKVIQHGGGQINGLHQRGAVYALAAGTRIPDEQRRVDQFLIVGAAALAPVAVLTEEEAVVSVDDEHGIFP